MLELPPHKTLPTEVRDRIRAACVERPPGRTVRYRAPVSVGAGVAVLVASVVMVSQSAYDTPDGVQPGATASSSPPPDLKPTEPIVMPGQQMEVQLDGCASVVRNQYVDQYAPRATWQATFDAGVPGGGIESPRLIAFREAGDRAVFCEISENTAVLSLPTAAPLSLGTSAKATVDVYFLSPARFLAGTTEHVDSVEFINEPRSGKPTHRTVLTPSIGGLFAVNIASFDEGGAVRMMGRDAEGNVVVTDEFTLDQVPGPGASGRL